MKRHRSFRDAQRATSRVRSNQCTATTTQSSPWLKLITSNVQCAMRGVYGIDARAIVDARAYGVHQLLRLPLCSKAPQTVRTAPVPLVPVLPFARCRVPPPRRLRTHSLPSPLCARRIAPCRVRGVPWSPRGRRSWAAAAGADCSWSFVSGDEVRLNWLLSDNT